MNVPHVSPSLPTKHKASSPRPRPVGQETRTFHDVFTRNAQETYIVEEAPKEMENARPSEACAPPPSPPPARRWAQGLPFLLDDHQGVSLFREFLNQEGHETKSLDFWFGVRGLKKPEVDAKDIQRCIPILYYKMVNKIPLISQSTKDEIRRKINSVGVLSVDIFDAAQEEVEEYMSRTTYPNFLRSELYIQQVQGVRAVEEVCGEAELQTLYEDRELSLQPKRIEIHNLFRYQKKNAKSKAEAQTAFLNSPSAPYHTSYAPFLPASARDSEVQSLSSGVQTGDATSQSSNSMSDHNVHRKHPQKARYKFTINKDHELESTFVPLTSRKTPEGAMMHSRSMVFIDTLTKKLEEVQRQRESQQTVNKKLGSIESSTTVKSMPRQNIPYIPEEENDQSILDQHINLVFPEITPDLLSPACATPPAKDPRLQGASWSPADSTPAREARASPFTVPFAGRFKRDADTRHSNDKGWISEDNLRVAQSDYDIGLSYNAQARRAREKQQQSKNLSILAGSRTSFFDSGVSSVCESVQLVHTKVTNSLEPRRCSLEAENDRRAKNSPDLARSYHKAAAYTSSRVPDPSQWPVGQPGDLPPQDTMASLKEARKRLEDETRNKSGKSKYVSTGRNSHDATRGKVSSRGDAAEDGLSHRKQSKKSTSSGNSSSCGETTVVGYSYGLGSTPFKSKLEGKNPTLKQFKTLLNKRGNFRYFFKSLSDDFGTTLVYDEVTDDHALLPLWEGKVFCVIEAMDDQNNERSTPWGQEASSQEIKL